MGNSFSLVDEGCGLLVDTLSFVALVLKLLGTSFFGASFYLCVEVIDEAFTNEGGLLKSP